jgi:hypothetical protein
VFLIFFIPLLFHCPISSPCCIFFLIFSPKHSLDNSTEKEILGEKQYIKKQDKFFVQ